MLVIAPSVTVNDSAVSDRLSSVAVIVMLCVAPAAAVGREGHCSQTWRSRSATAAASVPKGALHVTCTSAATAFDSVTVKVALAPL